VIPYLLKVYPLLSKQSNAARHVGAWPHIELTTTVQEAKKALVWYKERKNWGKKLLLFEVVVQHLAC